MPWCVVGSFLRTVGRLIRHPFLQCSFILSWEEYECTLLIPRKVKCYKDYFLLHTHKKANQEVPVQGIIALVLLLLVWYKGKEHEGSRVPKVKDSHWCTLLGAYLWNKLGLLPNAINRKAPRHLFLPIYKSVVKSTQILESTFVLGNLQKNSKGIFLHSQEIL